MVENVSAGGFGALAPQAKSDWLKVGALVAAQPDGGAELGGRRGAARQQDLAAGESRVGIETLSRAPALSHFVLRNAGEAEACCCLGGSRPGEASIALRAGVYARGENLEADRRRARSTSTCRRASPSAATTTRSCAFKEMVRES